jgi:addiction module HigA family antidote
MPIARTRPLAGPAPHPGEVLKDELEARGLSPHALALALRLPASRISQIVRGQRAITPETALRLARYFGGSAALWLRLQVAYDLSCAETELADKIAAEVTPAAARSALNRHALAGAGEAAVWHHVAVRIELQRHPLHQPARRRVERRPPMHREAVVP